MYLDWLLTETKDYLRDGQDVILRVTGNSMLPYLRSGKDLVVLSPIQPADLKAGKIVFFQREEKIVCHRIIGRQGELFVIQGDGVLRNKDFVPESDIFAAVHKIVRPNGKEVSTDSIPAKCYWFFWRAISPFRRVVLGVLRLILN